MLRVDPFTTYAYCCRWNFLPFLYWNSSGQWTNARALRVCCNMVTSVSPTKFLKTVTTGLPLHFISSLHCAPLKRLFGILFFVAPSSRCLSDWSSPGLKPPCAFCFFKYCWQVQDAAFDVYWEKSFVICSLCSSSFRCSWRVIFYRQLVHDRLQLINTLILRPFQLQ